MDKITTENRYLLSDETFYKIDGDELIPVDKITGKNFTIIISDKYFFYDEAVIKNLPLKNRKEILKNQLLLKYPEELIQNFYYVYENDVVHFLIPNKDFLELLSKHKDEFKHAKKITTEHLIEKNIKHPIQITSSTNDEIKKLLPAIVILSIALIIFIIGKNIELNKYKTVYDELNQRINNLYKNAGVLNTNDPYGMLLFKVKKKQLASKSNILDTLSELSTAIKHYATIDELEIKDNTITVKGVTNDFATLDKIKEALSDKFGQTNVTVLNTTKKNNNVIFTIRLEK